jgi:hypothetical protein
MTVEKQGVEEKGDISSRRSDTIEKATMYYHDGMWKCRDGTSRVS